MDHPRCRSRLRLLRLFTAGLATAGLPLLGLGCATPSSSGTEGRRPETPPMVQATRDKSELQLVSHTVEELPEHAVPKKVPITLDTVLRLSDQHNPRIGQAREKVNESLLIQEQNCNCWLPHTYAGIAYYRHEGGIQNEDGTLTHSSTQALYPALQVSSEIDLRERTYQQVNSEREVWQHKAELSQLDSEVLLDAATTYIDLLMARRGEAVARMLEDLEKKVLPRAEALEKADLKAKGLISAAKAAASNRRQLAARLRQQGNAASLRLVYLLGLPPETCLEPVDLLPAPFDLVDVTPCCHDLVTQAMTNGPAVRELEQMLHVIQSGIDRSYGLGNLVPALQLNVVEGAFGAGPGSQMSFDNRLDVGVALRWNLTQLATAESQRKLARSRQMQAMLNYEDVRNKLAAGVQEARDAILLAHEQIGMAREEIEHADQNYRARDRQLELKTEGVNTNDVLIALRALGEAHFNFLNSISSHNKAQVRMLLLLGCGSGEPGPGCKGPACAPEVPPPEARPPEARPPEGPGWVVPPGERGRG
jgi:outer membrane protein TolC